MLRNGGETLFNYITIPKDDTEYGRYWEYHGLTLADKYQVVTQAKLDDLRHRTVDPEAIHCVIPMTATGESNSLYWVELRKQLDVNNIKFLIPINKREELITDNGLYFELTTEEVVVELSPYGQVDELVLEAVNLKAEYIRDKIKLTEPKNGTKDRVICLAYANYIATLIENEWNKQQQEADFDVSDWQLVY